MLMTMRATKRHVTKAARAVKLDRIVYMLICQLIYGHHNKSDNNSNNKAKTKIIIIKITMYVMCTKHNQKCSKQKHTKYTIYLYVYL